MKDKPEQRRLFQRPLGEGKFLDPEGNVRNADDDIIQEALSAEFIAALKKVIEKYPTIPKEKQEEYARRRIRAKKLGGNRNR